MTRTHIMQTQLIFKQPLPIFCFRAEPEIVKTNIGVLVQEGLGERAESDYLLAQGVCQAVLTLAQKPKVC